MAHLGTFFLQEKQTTEQRFKQHVIGILRRGRMMAKSHGKLVYFDSIAEQEAPKFGYKWEDGKLTPYVKSEKTIRDVGSKDV